MARINVDAHFQRIETMVVEIESFVPEKTKGAVDFRADLAGLLVVAMTSSYESCVKEVMINYASSKHVDFEQFVNNQFAKLSSKVSVNDLEKYAKLFDAEISARFQKILTARKKAIYGRTGKNIVIQYRQILSWRHDFAHAGVKNTTIGEAIKFHRFAKRVLYCFDEAFSEID